MVIRIIVTGESNTISTSMIKIITIEKNRNCFPYFKLLFSSIKK